MYVIGKVATKNSNSEIKNNLTMKVNQKVKQGWQQISLEKNPLCLISI
jgi:hypothetical protein